MSSPQRKSMKSPNKARPSTAVISPKKFAGMDRSSFSQITIIEQLNGIEIQGQDKDIEIERLQTTCFTLNNQVSITQDLKQENAMLRNRLSENETARMTLNQHNDVLIK